MVIGKITSRGHSAIAELLVGAGNGVCNARLPCVSETFLLRTLLGAYELRRSPIDAPSRLSSEYFSTVTLQSFKIPEIKESITDTKYQQ